MAFPDQIERSRGARAPAGEVWAALTTSEGLSAWFGDRATIDLRPGGAAHMTFRSGVTVDMRIERVEEPSGVRVHLAAPRPARGRSAPDLCRVHPRSGRAPARGCG